VRIIDPEKFSAIVRYARQTNPFYAQWIPPAGAIPILTRQILQENNDRILNGSPVIGRTSGSTGVPVRVSTGMARARMETEDYRRMINWVGGPLPRVEIVHPRPERPQENVIPIQTPLAGQILALGQRAARHSAMTLATYPTNAVLLAQAILDQHISFPTIRRVLLMSESVDPGQRAIIQRAFPEAHVWVTYSSVEVGAISCQCPHEPGFHHIMSHKLGVEILDDRHEPAPFGEIGQLVITDYFNRRMPLIRYAIGDLAAFGQCPCGKIPLPAFSQVLGKVRGSLLHPDGRRVPFVQLSVALRDLPGVRQYQVIQEELRRFTVKIVAAGNLDAGIHAAFLEEFGYAPHLDILYVENIPRDPSGKFSISICKV
jgi:phenylacetate-CoA ligase